MLSNGSVLKKNLLVTHQPCTDHVVLISYSVISLLVPFQPENLSLS